MQPINVPGPGRRAILGAIALAASAIAAIGRSAEAAGESAVRIDNFTFAPAAISVRAGTTVRWTNNDDIPHSIYCQALGLRSHPMDTGESFAYTFDRPGSFAYVCGIHPHMHGRVIVAA